MLAPTPIVAAPASQHITELHGEVCNVQADYFLGIEDYADAICSHREVISRDSRNALAHYHLGFAYGMIGRRQEELKEYRRAVSLGLVDWTLFLNLGLVYLERGDARSAVNVLGLAALLAPERPEPHYNLALAYDQLAKLLEAEEEGLRALVLNPHDPDVLNTLAVLSAEEGDYTRARQEWLALLVDHPGFEPAKANLAILDQLGHESPKRIASELAEKTTHELGRRLVEQTLPPK